MSPYCYSTPRPALFLHIQKTGGSSILSLARRAYGSAIGHAEYASMSDDELARVEFLSSHIGFDLAKIHLDARHSFTFHLRLGRNEFRKGASMPVYQPWRRLLAGSGPVVIVCGRKVKKHISLARLA